MFYRIKQQRRKEKLKQQWYKEELKRQLKMFVD